MKQDLSGLRFILDDLLSSSVREQELSALQTADRQHAGQYTEARREANENRLALDQPAGKALRRTSRRRNYRAGSENSES